LRSFSHFWAGCQPPMQGVHDTTDALSKYWVALIPTLPPSMRGLSTTALPSPLKGQGWGRWWRGPSGAACAKWCPWPRFPRIQGGGGGPRDAGEVDLQELGIGGAVGGAVQDAVDIVEHCTSSGVPWVGCSASVFKRCQSVGSKLTRRGIPPFLTGCIRRSHAAIFSFWAGVMPPMPMFGRSLL